MVHANTPAPAPSTTAARPHGPDAVPMSMRAPSVRPAGDQPIDGRVGEAEAARDVVGRAHRQDGDRHVAAREMARDEADGAVAAGDRDQVGGLVEPCFPAPHLARLVRELVSRFADHALEVLAGGLPGIARARVVDQHHPHGRQELEARIGTQP